MPIVEIPGLGDVEFPDSLEPDALNKAVNRAFAQAQVPGGVWQKAAQHKAAILAGDDLPHSSNLTTTNFQTPVDPGYEARAQRVGSEGAKQFNEAVTPDPNGSFLGAMLKELDPRKPMNAIAGATKVLGAPLKAGSEEYHRKVATDVQNVQGPEVEQIARGYADMDMMAIENLASMAAGGGFKGKAKGVPSVPGPKGEVTLTTPEASLGEAPEDVPTVSRLGEKPVVQQTAQGPIVGKSAQPTVAETSGGEMIELNDPPEPELQAQVNATVSNPNDPISSTKEIAAKVGVPEPVVTAGEVPISRSFVDDAGTPNIDLANGTPSEAVHEIVGHVKPEIDGTPHMPEDNNAITREYLEGTVYTDKPTGKKWAVGGYNDDTGMYEVSDEKTGFTSEASADTIGRGDPVQPRPPRQPVEGAASEPPKWNPGGAAPAQTAEQLAAKVANKGPVRGPVLPKQPTALGDENFLGAGAEGPKEALTASSDEPPPGVTEPWRGEAGHSAETVKAVTKQEAKKPRGILARINAAMSEVTNAGTAAMTSAPGTAARNARSQIVVMTADAMDTAAGNVGNRLYGRPTNPNSSLYALGRLFTSVKNDHAVWRELEKTSEVALGLEDSYMADVPTRKFSNATVQKIADIHSWMNKTVEGWFRRAKGMAHLETVAQERFGMSATDAIMSGKGKFTEDEIAEAIDGARRVTFAQEPKKGSVAEWALQGRKFWGIRAIQPFLRMGYNLGKFSYEHSPIAAAKLFKPEFLDSIKGNSPEAMRQLGAMINGTATLAAVALGTGGAVLKMKDYDSLAVAGEKLNISPENPMSLWLLAGFLGKRVLRHDPAPMYEKDLRFIADTIANVGSLGDTNAPAVDALMKDLLGITQGVGGDRWKASGELVMDAAGRWLARFPTMVGALNDIMSGYDPELGIKREAHGILGPSIAKIPYLNKTLPPRYGTDYAGPQFEEQPVLKQVLGMRFEHKGSAANDELEKYQIRPPGKPFGPGYPELNNEYRKLMMEKFDELALPKIKEDKYQNSGNEHRRYLIKHYLAGASAWAKAQVEKSLPEADRKDFLMSNEYKRLLQEDADESNKNGAVQ